jgi:UDP-N-acetylmuramyl pentapeptide phosphotransferase/UDP-N-acetylglucosamine-1-phosphate transferase
MGDSGSLSLGYTLGFFAIKTAMDHPVIWQTRPEAILFPLTLLFVPIADVVRVTLYRLYHRKPLFDADKNHIHHKLMRSGMNQYQTLAAILLLTVAIYAINYLLYPTLSSTIIIGIDILLYLLVNTVINLRIKSVL